MSRRKKKQASDNMSGTYIERKLTASEMNRYERELDVWFEQQEKAIEKAVAEFPKVKDVYERIKKGEPVKCEELQETLEEVRLSRDNLETNMPKWRSLDRLFSWFKYHFKERCPDMAKVYEEGLLVRFKQERRRKRSKAEAFLSS